MFNPGELIRVKENGLTGFVERWNKKINKTTGLTLTYDIRWTHDQYRTCSYDFSHESEAELIWELESPQATQQAWQNSQNVYRAAHGIDFIPITVTISECEHEWAEYTGLMQSFRYCKKCDKKDT